MKREAFKAVGNPLLMGGPVLFSRGAGGGPPPPEDGLTIGADGGAWGFVRGGVGDLRPDTVYGVEVEFLLNLDADGLELGMVGGGQIAGVTTVIADMPGLPGGPFALTWNPGSSSYLNVGGVVGAEAYFVDNIGVTVPLTLFPAGFGIEYQPSQASYGMRLDTGLGFIYPPTVGGVAIDVFTMSSDNALSLFLVGSVQIPGVNWIDLTLAGFAGNPIRLTWSFDEYRATGVPGGTAFFTANAGQILQFTLTPETPSLDAQVEAILAGTTGFVLDPQDLSTMSQVIAGTTPVTADGQPIGRFASKWGTVSEVWTSLNDGAARPVLASGGLLYDGVDDFLQNSPNNIFRNVPAMFVCMRMAMSDMGSSSERTILTFSNTTTGSIRFVPRTTAGLGLILRSAGPGAETRADSAAGLLVNNDPMVLSFLADYATGGRNRVWLDGAQVADIASVAAGGPTLDQDSAIGRIMRASTASFPGFGKIGRMVFCPFTPTDPQRAVLEAWVASGPFDPPPVPPVTAEQWAQPTDFTSLPPDGGLVSHNGQNWKNISIIGNLWEPGIFGWEAEP